MKECPLGRLCVPGSFGWLSGSGLCVGQVVPLPGVSQGECQPVLLWEQPGSERHSPGFSQVGTGWFYTGGTAKGRGIWSRGLLGSKQATALLMGQLVALGHDLEVSQVSSVWSCPNRVARIGRGTVRVNPCGYCTSSPWWDFWISGRCVWA